MRRIAIGIILLGLVLYAAAGAAAQQIFFKELPREVIQSRLARFANRNFERQASLRKIFEEAGCTGDQLKEQPVKHENLGNLVCTLPGTTDSLIVVGGHFDAVDEGDGVADNWSGAVLLPSLFESLRSRQRQHTFIFVGFSSEEEGLIGSQDYVNKLNREQREKIRAMVNLDTLGLESTQVWLSHSDAKLVKMMARVAGAMKLPMGATNFEKVGGTDSEPFENKKVPSLTVHSVTQRNIRVLHSPDDKLRAINLDQYYGSYRLVAGFLAYADGALDQTEPVADKRPER